MTTEMQLDGQVMKDTLSHNELDNAQIICVIGGPSVGKGTQCAWLAKDLKVAHVSLGELLRAKLKEPPKEDSVDIEGRMRDGLLLPKEFVQETLRLHLMDRMKQGMDHFLVDGFPRSLEQARLFEASGGKVKAILYFDASKAVMEKRMLKRSETSGRIDDTTETFEKRYRGFKEEIQGILEYFQLRGNLHKIDCEGALDNVYKIKVHPLVTEIFSIAPYSAEKTMR